VFIVILFPALGLRLLLFHDDYDFAACVTFLQIADRGLRLTDFVSAVDHRSDFSGLHEVAQKIQIAFGQLRDVKDKLLIGKVGQESVPKISANSA
jgi:hypothetical protein